MPETYQGLVRIQNAIGSDSENEILEHEFYQFHSESIDYGIMEKADNIYIYPGAFGWDDVGSWLAVGRIKKTDHNGNVISGNVITVNSQNNIIEGSDKLIATVGTKDLIIVDTNDATLICAKDSASDIKKVLEQLRINKKENYI